MHRAEGLVSDVFDTTTLEGLSGDAAIGHNRYSTTGSPSSTNTQPIVVNYRDGFLAIAHNGNLVNARTVRRRLERSGSIFQSTMDTEVLVHLIAGERDPSRDRAVLNALEGIRGAYSVLLLTSDGLYAARDPRGFRPLVLGRREGVVVFASESCALDLLDVPVEREVEPGEVLKATRDGRVTSLREAARRTECMCVFERIYFARPDSVLFGTSVDESRRRLGRELARESPVEADCVIAVPDSSNSAALGYAEASGLPFELGLIRNHYVGRTFIQPGQEVRDFRCKVKYNPVRNVLAGRRVVVVDDSIVRGTTSKSLVGLVRDAGAREVHMRIASPPLRHPCYYGIDMSTEEELFSTQLRLADREKHLLGKIEAALTRIETGDIDQCEDCDEPIGYKRLAARPVTTLCIACKEDRESTE